MWKLMMVIGWAVGVANVANAQLWFCGAALAASSEVSWSFESMPDGGVRLAVDDTLVDVPSLRMEGEPAWKVVGRVPSAITASVTIASNAHPFPGEVIVLTRGELWRYAPDENGNLYFLGRLRTSGSEVFHDLRSVTEMRDGRPFTRVFARALPGDAFVSAGFDGTETKAPLFYWDFPAEGGGDRWGKRFDAQVVSSYSPVAANVVLAFEMSDVRHKGNLVSFDASGRQLTLAFLSFPGLFLPNDLADFSAQSLRRVSSNAGALGVEATAHILTRDNARPVLYQWSSSSGKLEKIARGLPSALDTAVWSSVRLVPAGNGHVLLAARFSEAGGVSTLRFWKSSNEQWLELPAAILPPRHSPGSRGVDRTSSETRPKVTSPKGTFETRELPADAREKLLMHAREWLRGRDKLEQRANAVVDALLTRLRVNAEMGIAPGTRYARWTAYLIGADAPDIYAFLSTESAMRLQAHLAQPVNDGRANLARFRNGEYPPHSTERDLWTELIRALARYVGESESDVYAALVPGRGESELEPGFMSDVESFLQTRDPFQGWKTYDQVLRHL